MEEKEKEEKHHQPAQAVKQEKDCELLSVSEHRMASEG